MAGTRTHVSHSGSTLRVAGRAERDVRRRGVRGAEDSGWRLMCVAGCCCGVMHASALPVLDGATGLAFCDPDASTIGEPLALGVERALFWLVSTLPKARGECVVGVVIIVRGRTALGFVTGVAGVRRRTPQLPHTTRPRTANQMLSSLSQLWQPDAAGGGVPLPPVSGMPPSRATDAAISASKLGLCPAGGTSRQVTRGSAHCHKHGTGVKLVGGGGRAAGTSRRAIAGCHLCECPYTPNTAAARGLGHQRLPIDFQHLMGSPIALSPTAASSKRHLRTRAGCLQRPQQPRRAAAGATMQVDRRQGVAVGG